MKQKKPKINSVGWQHMRVYNNKTNKAQANRFCSTASRHSWNRELMEQQILNQLCWLAFGKHSRVENNKTTGGGGTKDIWEGRYMEYLKQKKPKIKYIGQTYIFSSNLDQGVEKSSSGGSDRSAGDSHRAKGRVAESYSEGLGKSYKNDLRTVTKMITFRKVTKTTTNNTRRT